MGMTPQLGRFVVAASIVLAILSRQGWWDVSWYPGNTVPGQSVHALTYVGDGNVVLIGALMTFALGLVALMHAPSSRLAGVMIALAGTGMCGVTVYDIVQVPSLSDYVLDALIDRAAPANALYFSAMTCGLIGLAGAIMAAMPDERARTDQGVTQDGAYQW